MNVENENRDSVLRLVLMRVAGVGGEGVGAAQRGTSPSVPPLEIELNCIGGNVMRLTGAGGTSLERLAVCRAELNQTALFDSASMGFAIWSGNPLRKARRSCSWGVVFGSPVSGQAVLEV